MFRCSVLALNRQIKHFIDPRGKMSRNTSRYRWRPVAVKAVKAVITRDKKARKRLLVIFKKTKQKVLDERIVFT